MIERDKLEMPNHLNAAISKYDQMEIEKRDLLLKKLREREDL
jgi:hypothetical protein